MFFFLIFPSQMFNLIQIRTVHGRVIDRTYFSLRTPPFFFFMTRYMIVLKKDIITKLIFLSME